jgi:Ca-activated chloride channel homolog
MRDEARSIAKPAAVARQPCRLPGESIDASGSGAHAHEVAARTLPPRPVRDPAAKAVPPGSYASPVIVLLTDGQNRIGPEPMEAAKFAASRGVSVWRTGSVV